MLSSESEADCQSGDDDDFVCTPELPSAEVDIRTPIRARKSAAKQILVQMSHLLWTARKSVTEKQQWCFHLQLRASGKMQRSSASAGLPYVDVASPVESRWQLKL